MPTLYAEQPLVSTHLKGKKSTYFLQAGDGGSDGPRGINYGLRICSKSLTHTRSRIKQADIGFLKGKSLPVGAKLQPSPVNLLIHFIAVGARWCLVSNLQPGNTKGESIIVPLTSCLTGLDWSVLQIKTKIASCHTADSKPVK